MKQLVGIVSVIGLVIALASCGGGSSGGGGTLPSITRFTATPNTITKGENTTLAWNATGQQTLTINPNIGKVTGKNSITITPTKTTSYTLVAPNTTGTDTATTNVTVNAPPPAANPVLGWIRQFEARLAIQVRFVNAHDLAALSWWRLGSDGAMPANLGETNAPSHHHYLLAQRVPIRLINNLRRFPPQFDQVDAMLGEVGLQPRHSLLTARDAPERLHAKIARPIDGIEGVNAG